MVEVPSEYGESEEIKYGGGLTAKGMMNMTYLKTIC